MSDDLSPTRYPRRRLTAATLAIFLGWLGLHKFYLGQPLWGIVYLLFAVTGIPFIASLIEGVMLFITSDERFNELHNRPKLLDRKHPKAVAITMAFFFGGLGIHKFYLRQTIAGLIYLTATIFGAYLSYQAIDATGIFQSFKHMNDLEMLQAFQDIDRTKIPGLMLPSILMLIPTLGGFADAIALMMMSKEDFEREYGLTQND